MEFLYVIALLTTGVWCEQMQVIGRTNGEKIPLDISLEEDFMVALTGRQTDPPQPGYRQSINLYDFHKHLEARKLSNEDICFIRPFLATYEETRLILENAQLSADKETEHVTEDWNTLGEEIPADRLVEVGGEKIADFCAGSRVVWGLQEPVLQDKPESIEEKLPEPDDKRNPRDQQEVEHLTSVNKVKRSSRRLRTNFGTDAQGIRGQAVYENGPMRTSLQGGYRWDGSYDGQINGRYRGRNGDADAMFGYHTRRGYGGSVRYRNDNVDANAGFNYDHTRRGYEGSMSYRNGNLNADAGFNQRGYGGSVRYRNDNVDANAGFNYDQRNGLGFSAGVEFL